MAFILVGVEGTQTDWECDLVHPILDKVWCFCCTQTKLVTPNHLHKLLHYKFQHHAYTTPQDLAKMYPTVSHHCPKCDLIHADFAHLTRNCPVIQSYWTQVLSSISEMTELTVEPDPLLALLGYVKPLLLNIRCSTAIALLLAKCWITIFWGSRGAPPRMPD